MNPNVLTLARGWTVAALAGGALATVALAAHLSDAHDAELAQARAREAGTPEQVRTTAAATGPTRAATVATQTARAKATTTAKTAARATTKAAAPKPASTFTPVKAVAPAPSPTSTATRVKSTSKGS